MRVQQALELFLTQLRADGRSPHTVAQNRRHVRLFIGQVGDVEVATLTHEHVASFCASSVMVKRADGGARKPSSGNSLRSSLRNFLGYLHAAGFTAANVGRLIRRARCAPPRPRALSDAEVELIRGVLASAGTRAERRDRVLVEMMLRTGLRVGSVAGLDVSDVNLDLGELRIRRLKNGGESVVYLPPEMITILREHIGARADGALFPGQNRERMCVRQIGRRVEEVARRSGIELRVSCHALRRTFGTRIFARTSNVFLTARALGHRGLNATLSYVAVQEDALRAAVCA